jgi:hypothetical protein
MQSIFVIVVSLFVFWTLKIVIIGYQGGRWLSDRATLRTADKHSLIWISLLVVVYLLAYYLGYELPGL